MFDISQHPRLVEFFLNSPEIAPNLLHEISGEKLGCYILETTIGSMDQFIYGDIDQNKFVHEFKLAFMEDQEK